MADIFISYSKGSQAQTRHLADQLRAKGFSVWFDTSLVAGDSFRDVITSQLAQARAVIVIWTADSVKSDWVCAEASRARARGILIPVRDDDVRSHDIPLPFDSLHTEALSNSAAIETALAKLGVVPKPALSDAEVAPKTVAADAKEPAVPLSRKPSIAVLPFHNMSGDATQEFLADGMVEEITTALSHIRQFLVIARNSSFTYKGQSVNVKEVGRELGVDYVLEGSVRRAADRVRVTAQLIDAITGHHIWAQNYDRELADIFALQDEIAGKVVSAIEPQLYSAERLRVRRKQPESLDAWECVVDALAHIDARSKQDLASARGLLERAIGLDPFYAHAHAVLVYVTSAEVNSGWKPVEALEGAFEVARRAIAMDDSDAWGHFALGNVCLHNHRATEAVVEFERALALNPNFAPAFTFLGTSLSYLGRGEEALSKIEMSERLNPRGLVRGQIDMNRAVAYYVMGKHRDALDCAMNAVQENPSLLPAHRSIVVNSALLGKLDEATRELDSLKRLQPNLTLKWINEWNPYVAPEARAKWIRGFVLAGLT
jgi:TolB-like protein/Flp pilus assembly protein TadD